MSTELTTMKKNELVETCKNEGIKGYSTLNKEDIIELIISTRNTEFQKLKIKTIKHTKITLESNSLNQLRELAKELGIKTTGKKEELIKNILSKKKKFEKEVTIINEKVEKNLTSDNSTYNNKTKKDLVEIAKKNNIKNSNQMKKEELIKVLIEYERNNNMFTFDSLNKNKMPELIEIAKELNIKNFKKQKKKN